MSLSLRNSLLLILTAFIWGTAFVAQSVGMDYIGPLTFTAARSVLGAVSLFFLAGLFDALGEKKKSSGRGGFWSRWSDRKIWVGGICCGVFLLTGTLFQQFGLLSTTVGKAGFVTSLYIVIVPIAGFLIGRAPTRLAFFAVPVALVGLFFLCFHEETLRVQTGDVLMLFGAFAFSAHILIIDRLTSGVDAVRMSCVQFLFCSVFASLGAVLFETFTLGELLGAAESILYAGVLSSAVAYTLQIVGQRGVNPTVASLLLSLESVISVLAGWVILHQALSARELLGCALMAAAIVLAQLPDRLFCRSKTSN